eukprot:CCRYP_017211-RA/>CCRYP_017211-RA protein AED:0.47 eAED:0.47 QI:0/-1/0/1/-1/1/1/0/84
MTNQPNPTSTTPVAIPAFAPLPKPNAANSRSMQLSLTQLLLATLAHTPQPKPNSLPPQQQAPAQRACLTHSQTHSHLIQAHEAG